MYLRPAGPMAEQRARARNQGTRAASA